MNDIEIRPAEAGDADGIARIYNQIIRETTITFVPIDKTPEEIAASLPKSDAYLVAVRGQEILGFASFGPFRKGIGYKGVKEHSICLDETARGLGLGQQMLGALEKIARAQGVHSMVAGVSGENDAGITFHAKQGYQRVGHLPGIGQKFGRRIDLILMQKSL